MKHIIPLISLLIISLSTIAQDFNHYTLLKNKGEIPEQFINNDTVISWEHVSHSEKIDSKEDAKSRLAYLNSANFFIKYLLQSGQLMYGTSLNEFADNVLNKVLESHSEYQDVFTIYITRYPEVNAACLPNGILLINIGLIAQLENEAQLAYIISHEIIHYIKKHGIESYIELQKISKQEDSEKSQNDRTFAMLGYQKELEFEADELGFKDFFSKTNYKLEEAEAVCDILLYSEFPVDEIEFTKDLIEDEYFKLPAKNWMDTVDLITAIENYDDEKLTHPNIKKRRSRIHNMLQAYNDNGTEFIQSKEQFFLIRDIARFELLNIFLSEGKYIDAIYLTHVLSKKYPNSDYLIQSKAKSYYGLLKLYNNKNKNLAFENYKEVKGESQRVFYMLKSLKVEQLNIIACRELWKCHTELPDDELIMDMTTQAFSNLTKLKKIDAGYFALRPPVSDSTRAEIDSTKMSKYDKIKMAQQDFSKYEAFQLAFLKFAENQEFLDFYKQFSFETRENTSYSYVKYNKKIEEYTYKKPDLGSITNLVICNPFYFRYDNKKYSDRLYTSYEYERNYVSMLISIAKSRGMTISVYDVAELFSNNTEEYNDIQTIDYWYNELSYNDTILNLSSFQTEINDISNRIGTPYIAFTGIRAEKIIKDKSVLAYSIVLPFFIPFIAAYVFTPAHRIYYFFDVYDTSTGRLVYSEVQIMKSKDHEQNIKKLIYNTCNNLIK